MYNRYIPNPDGTYQKNRVQIPNQKPSVQQEITQLPEFCDAPQPVKEAQSAGSFLRQLLPKNLDTGDLLIIVLLLLIAGDCNENKNTWLLTLALYLFL